jgi:NADPH-dependent ferric siderophore reductase
MMDNNQSANPLLSAPAIERVRHELRRRRLTVESVADVTSGMRRIVLTGEDLVDFVSLAPDHIKVIVPTAGGAEERRD